MEKIAAVIVAAGRGERVGEHVPKQYLPLAGRPLLNRTVGRLDACEAIGPIQVVIGPGQDDLFRKTAGEFDILPAVVGGETRQASVLNGLRALQTHRPQYVMIHDAARPFVSAGLIERLRQALADGARAVIPVLAMTDTIKSCVDGLVTGTLERHELVCAQTPQAFGFGDILSAHEVAAGREYTDDAAVAEAAGMTVRTVAGEDANMKLTVPGDFERAERWLERFETRVGSGIDVHAFAPGNHVMLCGVRVDHDRSLAGETDADVGLHALVDAILGALGEGDLGTHFGTGDPAWKGRPSSDLVEVACDLVRRHRARLLHVDITLVCQEPRLARYQPVMAERVAGLLGIGLPRVNVKVTSTDGLGFTGRGEGIAGHATVTVEYPAS